MTDWTLIGAGVDWITATCSKNPRVSEFLTYGTNILEKERLNGNPSHPANFLGYHGSSSLHVFVGYRKDGACIRLGGPAARLSWAGLARQSTNVTRLDIAVTAKADPPTPGLAMGLYFGIDRNGTSDHRGTGYQLYLNTEGGASVYCGSRKSPFYGRLYDKHAESRGRYPLGSWRWEVEYKADAVRDAVAIMSSRANPALSALRLVKQRFADWQLPVPWQASLSEIKPFDDRGVSTIETKMKWLGSDVAATVKKVSDYRTHYEILRALDLTVRCQPDDKEWAESVLMAELDELLG